MFDLCDFTLCDFSSEHNCRINQGIPVHLYSDNCALHRNRHYVIFPQD
jgi:hypothetical protein